MKKLIILFLCFPFIIYSQIRLPLEKQTPPLGTSHEQMMDYLEKITRNSDVFQMEVSGKSHQNREIPVVYFPRRTQWEKNNTTVMVFAQQHGNEPSGKEALLMLLHELHLDPQNYDFEKLNLILVPMVNPDGNEADKRRNADGCDLNRNHVILTEPETQALHQLFEKYQPQVTLDVHEYGYRTWLEHGFIKDFGEQLDCISNPAIPAKLKSFAIGEILTPTLTQTRDRGVTANRYLITRSDMNHFVRHSTTDINDGRNGFGIRYTLSYILEGFNPLIKEEKIWQRGKHQLTLIENLLSICHEKSAEINKLVNSTRQYYSEQIPDSVVIHADYTAKHSHPLKVRLIRTADFRDTTVVLDDYRPEPEVIKMVKRPDAYLVPNPDQKILNLVRHHHFEHEMLAAEETMRAEAYHITGSDTLYYEGRDTIIPAGNFEETTRAFPKGSLIIPTDNLRAVQIVQIFEPESFYGIGYYEEFQDLLEHEVYSVYRVYFDETD